MKITKFHTSEFPLSTETLKKIIDKHNTSNVPVFNSRLNYYSGKHKILYKEVDEGRPNQKIVENLCNAIVGSYAGYGMGLPVVYSGKGIEPIIENFNYNDIDEEDNSFFREALIYGRAIEINYLDEDGISRFRTLPPTEVIPVLSSDLEEKLVYAIRLYTQATYEDDKTTYMVEVYDSTNKTVYASSEGFSSITLIGSEPHHFGQVPITVYDLNEEVESVCEQIYTLQDALDSVASNSANEVDAFVNSYLVLTGMTADAEDLAAMKKNRCILLDNDSDAKFLNHDASQATIADVKKDLEDRIWELSGAVNFADTNFGASSGIAIRYRLFNMESRISSYLMRFRKALQKRIELLCTILQIKGGDSTWMDVSITFNRNIPVDPAENATVVTQLRGIVSDETLLGLLPFVSDPKEELEKVNKQKDEEINLYSTQFMSHLHEDEEETGVDDL